MVFRQGSRDGKPWKVTTIHGVPHIINGNARSLNKLLEDLALRVASKGNVTQDRGGADMLILEGDVGAKSRAFFVEEGVDSAHVRLEGSPKSRGRITERPGQPPMRLRKKRASAAAAVAKAFVKTPR